MNKENTLPEKENKELNITTVLPEKECPNPGKYIALIILFAIIATVGWWMYYQEHQIKQQTVTKLDNVTDEKEEVTQELNKLLVQYDDLSTSNDSLNEQLNEQREKIKQLIEEIKHTKSVTRWQIAKYKKELGTLRQIMRGYIHQIDSLNTLNIALREENSQVKSKYTQVQEEKENLENKNNELLSKVDIASTLRAMNVNAFGINAKGKIKKKASKAEKIKVCFTIAQNKVVEAGPKDIYIRITDPNNKILGNKTISVNDTTISYSSFRTIEYDNRDLDVCVFWTRDHKLTKGNYKVDIFESGKIIGNTTFFLK